MTPPPRILLARRGGLGDALLAAPLLRALRRAHPAAALAFAGVREHADLLVALGLAEVAWSSEDLHAAARRGDRARHACAHAFVDDPALGSALPDGARVVAYAPQPRDERPLPLQLADACGLALQWPDDAVLAAPALRARSTGVVLAPGSGGRAKCWPRERWLQLAARCAAAGDDVVVLVGPVEQERDDPRRWPWPDACDFLVAPALPELAARLGRTSGFVGNDSGTTHLAAMVGTPTVALFGPTDPAVWAPTGPRVVVCRGGPAFALAVDEAAAALAAARARD